MHYILRLEISIMISYEEILAGKTQNFYSSFNKTKAITLDHASMSDILKREK